MDYKIGMIITGRITGLQPYGAFVSLDDNQQGLIHVSEVKNGYIKNIEDELEVGQNLLVQIIDIDEYTQKISLSLRTLQSDSFTLLHRKKKFSTNKNKKIGFLTLEKKLDNWVQESVVEILKNK